MRILYFISILLVLSFTTRSQPLLDWEYKNKPAYNYYPTTNVIHTAHGTYVCSQSIDADKTTYILRLNAAGNLVRQDTIHNFSYSILQNKRMVMDTHGSVYVCGQILDPLQYSKVRLIKYDSLLNKTWDIVYMDTSHVDYDLKGLLYSDTQDKIYLVADKFDGTSRIATVKFDLNGSVLWETTDTVHNHLSLVAYAVDHGGNVILGGYSFVSGGGEDFVITKLDTSGNIDWFVSEDGSNHSDDAVMDLCIDNLNNIYAAGRFDDSVPNKFMKYNPAGSKLWSRNVQDIYLPKVAVDGAGGLYIAGFDSVAAHECVIYKFDSAGNYFGSGFSDIPNYQAASYDYFVSIQTDDSANVYLLNNADSGGIKKWFVAKFNLSLGLQWSFIFPDSIPNPSTSSSLCLFNGGFTIAGAINNFSELRVLQFHETFPTGITDHISSQLISYGPNPTSNAIWFQLDEPIESDMIFRLYDMRSRLLLEKKVEMNNQSTFKIDLDSFSNGIYYFNMHSEKQNYNGKLIKEK